jgi:hypothetical protein
MASSDRLKEIGRQEASPVVMVIGIVILVLVLGAGGFYAFNGGWKTSGQQEYEYQHDTLPIYAAQHGNKEAFDAENKLRKEHGQPPLEMPKDKKSGTSVNDPEALKKLQDQLTAHGRGGGASQ